MPVPINTPLKRQIRLYELDTPVNVTFHKHGLEMGLAVRGNKTQLFVRWNDIADILPVPGDAPSIYAKYPFKYLQYLAKNADKRAEKLEAKRAKKKLVVA